MPNFFYFKAAQLAMHMLPTKEGLIQKIYEVEDEETTKKAAETLANSVTVMKQVYDVTQELYTQKELLALP